MQADNGCKGEKHYTKDLYPLLRKISNLKLERSIVLTFRLQIVFVVALHDL